TRVKSGGTLAPGNSVGTLKVNGNLTLDADSILSIELGTAADSLGLAGISDTIEISGNLIIDNGWPVLKVRPSENPEADGWPVFGYYRILSFNDLEGEPFFKFNYDEIPGVTVIGFGRDGGYMNLSLSTVG